MCLGPGTLILPSALTIHARRETPELTADFGFLEAGGREADRRIATVTVQARGGYAVGGQVLRTPRRGMTDVFRAVSPGNTKTLVRSGRFGHPFRPGFGVGARRGNT